ncbi:MAG: hypothetical protein JWO79_3214 [Actinomycetia bacterium]|nr:hypothetical protein [Actinomycetes bacterium]
MTGPAMPTVAVAGAGAAGTLTAIHLVAAAERAGTPLRILIADPDPHTGRGVAYGTTDRRHLLNVPAGKLSAWPADPGHFAAWLAAEGVPGAGPGLFAPRAEYGRYLAHTLAAASARARGLVRIDRAHAPITRAEPTGSGVRVTAGPARVDVDALVLALGSTAPCTGWAPDALARSSRFVADPWARGALAGIGGTSVLLVGTGLTMVDVALSLAGPGRRLRAISRHGLLPAVHADRPLPQLAPPVLPERLGMGELRTAIRRHVRASLAAHGDWRPAIDSLRPVTAEVWSRLPLADRAEFLRTGSRRWEVLRHRMAPAVGARLSALLQSGSLHVGAGEVESATESADGIEVVLRDGQRIHAEVVVNCTGPRCDYGSAADPLLRGLLDSGHARPGPLGLGLATDTDGRLTSTGGQQHALWTLGTGRRGELWECTAIPEIRAHAVALAEAIAARLSHRTPMPAAAR